jgi:hypothetical protein
MKLVRIYLCAVAAAVCCFAGDSSGARAKALIGVNLTGDWLWADSVRQARPQWDSTTHLGDGSALVDKNGWPIQDASIMLWEGHGHNDGTYTVWFKGKASLSADFNSASFSPQNADGTTGRYNSATNTTEATMVVADKGFQNFSLIFTHTQRTPKSPVGTGVTSVHVFRPIHEGATVSYKPGDVFTNESLDLVKKFSVVRFMDLLGTNGSNQQNWTDRKLPADWNQQAPLSYEYMIELCNQANVDCYLNIPMQASTDYVTKLAELFKYGSDGVNPYTSKQQNPVYHPLNSNLHLYIEYSNEVWNSGFQQFHQNLDDTKADIAAKNSEFRAIDYDGLDAGGPNDKGDYNNQYTLIYRRLAYVIVRTSNIFRSVFGDSAMPPNVDAQIRPIDEFQYDNLNQTASTALEFIDEYYGLGGAKQFVPVPHPVNYYLWGCGGASYYGSNNDSASSVDGIFSAGVPPTSYYGTIEREASWARIYGLKDVAYEGGWSLQISGGNGYENRRGSAAAEAKYDPRATQAAVDAQNQFNSAGGDLNVFYTSSSWDHNYVWNMTDFVGDLSEPLYKAVDVMNSQPPAPATAGSAVPGAFPAGAYLGSDKPASTNVQYVRTGWNENYCVNAAQGGDYKLVINYDSGNSNPNLLQVSVNGVVVSKTWNLPNTGDWGTAADTPNALTLPLVKGENGIRLVLRTGDINLHGVKLTVK